MVDARRGRRAPIPAADRPAVAWAAAHAPVLLVATVTLVAVEALRASGPLFDRLVRDDDLSTATVGAVIVIAAPAALGVLVRAVDARRATALTVLALVLLRLGMQTSAGFLLGTVYVVVALGALLLVLRHAADQHAGVVPAVTGLVLGAALDVALRTVLLTWDPVWRSGIVGWLVALVECAGLLGALLATRRLPWPDPYPVGRVFVLGGYLALSVLVVGSPAFVASAAGLRLAYASAVLLVGAVLTVVALTRSDLPGGSDRWPDPTGTVAAGLLVVGVAVAALASWVWVAAGVIAAQVGAALSLARAMTVVRVPRHGGPGFGLATLGAVACYVVTMLLYHVGYEVSQRFPSQLVLIGLTVLLGALAYRRPTSYQPTAPATGATWRDRRTARRARLGLLAVVPAVLLLAPALVLATPVPATPAETGRDSFRLVSWNVRYARTADGGVDPEKLATEIERQRADVVLLQEVSRGWAIGGGLDGAEWLSRRLGMQHVYQPAADKQFGNLILTRLRTSRSAPGELPQGFGTQRRSYAHVAVELDSGRTIDLYDVHLAHRKDHAPVRLAQVKVLLRAWDGEQPAIIAGDFNATPDSKVITKVTDSGLVSAQAATGHSGMPTFPADHPERRIDWIFGTPDLSFSNFQRVKSTTSDHCLLAVTVHLG